MDSKERRDEILTFLRQSEVPVNATVLARRFSVSRQVIVGDVALLRAGGAAVTATPRGYVIPRRGGFIYTIVCRHSAEDLGRELGIIVDNGCTAVDVAVEHPVYGLLTGALQISSRYDVGEFVRRVGESKAAPLSALTQGVHLHTLRCPDEAAFQRVCRALDEAGYLVRE